MVNDACDGVQEATNYTPHFTLPPPNLGNLVCADSGRAKRFAAYRKLGRAPVMPCVAAAGMLTAYIKVQVSRMFDRRCMNWKPSLCHLELVALSISVDCALNGEKGRLHIAIRENLQMSMQASYLNGMQAFIIAR